MDRRLMLEEDLPREMLKVWVLNPAGDNGFIRQAMQMLQIHQARHQPWLCRRAQKIILFRRAITMFHGKIKLQGFQCNSTKPCNS